MFFPHRISAVADWMSTTLPRWCGLTANLECRYEMCCTRARWKYRTQKIAICAPFHNFVRLYLPNQDTYRQSKNLFYSNIFLRRYNMVNFGPLAAEIGSLVWGTPANFNEFHVSSALLHSTLVVDISQTLRHWTEGGDYIRQGGHHVGYWLAHILVS